MDKLLERTRSEVTDWLGTLEAYANHSYDPLVELAVELWTWSVMEQPLVCLYLVLGNVTEAAER